LLELFTEFGGLGMRNEGGLRHSAFQRKSGLRRGEGILKRYRQKRRANQRVKRKRESETKTNSNCPRKAALLIQSRTKARVSERMPICGRTTSGMSKNCAERRNKEKQSIREKNQKQNGKQGKDSKDIREGQERPDSQRSQKGEMTA
jgi:hypothetical protein